MYKPRENFVEKQSQIYESRILNQQRYYEFFNQDDEFKKEPAIRLSSAQAHQYVQDAVLWNGVNATAGATA